MASSFLATEKAWHTTNDYLTTSGLWWKKNHAKYKHVVLQMLEEASVPIRVG